MKVYIVNYRGTIYGVFDSHEKALASEYGDYLDAQILEKDCVMSSEKSITQKMSLREAAQTALEVLEWCSDISQQTIQHQPLHDAINSLRGALADYDAFAEQVRKNFPTKREKTIVYIVVYQGTIYGVFDSREKALASIYYSREKAMSVAYGDFFDAQVIEREVQ